MRSLAQNGERFVFSPPFVFHVAQVATLTPQNFRRQSAVLPGKRSLGIAVMTPVRRSSRHSTHSTSPVASQKLLYKSNSALVDE